MGQVYGEYTYRMSLFIAGYLKGLILNAELTKINNKVNQYVLRNSNNRRFKDAEYKGFMAVPDIFEYLQANTSE